MCQFAVFNWYKKKLMYFVAISACYLLLLGLWSIKKKLLHFSTLAMCMYLVICKLCIYCQDVYRILLDTATNNNLLTVTSKWGFKTSVSLCNSLHTFSINRLISKKKYFLSPKHLVLLISSTAKTLLLDLSSSLFITFYWLGISLCDFTIN